MSGYLDVKYPFRSNLGLNPFKSWKRQWCILRPNATTSGGSLAVYCNEAGAAVGCVQLPSGCVVRRAKSRSHPHAFAVFSVEDSNKPVVLLAASNLQDAQTWMDKIKILLTETKILASDTPLKDSYSVTIVTTDLSRKCGLQASDGTVTLSARGILVTRTNNIGTFVEWKHVLEVKLCDDEKKGTCLVSVDSNSPHGGGDLKFASPLAGELVSALQTALHKKTRLGHKLSKSEGDLRTSKCSDSDLGEIRRSSWYSGPSEVSLDDMDLVISKEYKCLPLGQLSRCTGAGHLANNTPALDDSACDRRSIVSVSSGVYEEIPDAPSSIYCTMARDTTKMYQMKDLSVDEPTYESIAECGYATLRRIRKHPPPLPPRCMKSGESWSSLSALPHAHTHAHAHTHTHARTLPRPDKHKQTFNVFRKRLKSDSRVAGSPKSETSKDNKDVQPKKKKFEFAPTRDLLKSFKVSRKSKAQKTNTSLSKVETKSCEFLDETEHVKTNRCSKSVERLEGNDEYFDNFDTDLSIEFNDSPLEALTFPQEIVDLLLSINECKVRLRDDESEYIPMTPAVPPPPMEHHYIVMSPRSNLA